jgi:hypothetical protein
VQVAKMPRDIGTSTGVKDTDGAEAPQAMKFCRSSGVCRCTPPTPYALAEPISSEPSRCGFSARPAPDGPLAATMTTSRASVRPRAMAGSKASVAVVG